MAILRFLLLAAVAAAGAIFANVALLGVAPGDEPVGRLSPKLLLPGQDAGAAVLPPVTSPASSDEPATTATERNERSENDGRDD
jgi:hypothetical protein